MYRINSNGSAKHFNLGMVALTGTVGVICCLLAVTYALPTNESEVSKLEKASMEKCNKEHDVDIAAVRNIWKTQEIPEDREISCFVACVGSQFGIISDHKINLERAMEVNKMKYLAEDKIKMVNEITEKCAGEVPTDSTDDCEIVHKFISCGLAQAKEKGIPTHDEEDASS